MQMLYNSDTFVVVRFEVPTQAGRSDAPTRGAYEIVDKSARREIFIDGALAERFRREVQAMADTGANVSMATTSTAERLHFAFEEKEGSVHIPGETSQAARVAVRGSAQVWAKAMEDGSTAVGLFNLDEEEQAVAVEWADLELSGPRRVRDLWRQKDLGPHDGRFEARVPRHGCALIRLSPGAGPRR